MRTYWSTREAYIRREWVLTGDCRSMGNDRSKLIRRRNTTGYHRRTAISIWKRRGAEPAE